MSTETGAQDWRWLSDALGDDAVALDEHSLAQHGKDEGFARQGRKFLPEVVAFPQTTDEVVTVVREAARRGLRVTAWGAGTSMEGNGLPTRGGIVLDMSRMNRIVSVHPEDLQVVVEPGILRPDLNEQVARHGLFFPPDPGAPATIGGMVSNNASGTKSAKYGVTRDYVLGLEVVLADGIVIRTGSRAIKSASGYNLTGLFVGAEGTLGVITRITMRLAPLPAVVHGALGRFSSLDHAAKAVAGMIGAGVTPAMSELLDEQVIRVLNAEQETGWPERATLLLEFDGSSTAAVEDELELARAVIADVDPGAEFVTSSPDEHRRVTALRHGLGPTIFRSSSKPHIKVLDSTVPISRYVDLVRATRTILGAHGLEGFQLGHAGDGNLHVLILADAKDPEEWARVELAEDDIVEKALEFEGTTTGEHGVGLGRKRFMEAEHGRATDVMRAIKLALDPEQLLNPDKIVDIEL
jgi:D-lactate dehydrogenase (cytochrome)